VALRFTLRRVHPSLWLLLLTGGLAGAFIGATLYANHIARDIDRLAEDIVGNAYPSMRYLDAARTELREEHDALTTSVQGGGPVLLRKELAIHEQLMHRALNAYTNLPFFPSESERWQYADIALEEVEVRTNAFLSQLEAGNQKQAMALLIGPVGGAIDRADRTLTNLIALNTDHATSLLRSIEASRRSSEQVALTLDALAVVLALTLTAMAILSIRRQMNIIREAREVDRRLANRLRTVASSSLAISESAGQKGGVRAVLQVAAGKAREVAGADLAALGIGRDPSSLFDPFVFDGVEPGLKTLLGTPKPRGVLGVLIAEQKTVQIGDVGGDPRLEAMREQNSRMGPFLGVAVRDRTGVVGYLYLGRKPGAGPFSEEEAGAVELLAEFVGTAMQNANLNGSLREEVRAREDVLSMVSHDLRSPLSTVSMAAAVAQTSLGSEAPARRQIDLIIRNAGRMDRMIGDLLTAARLHEGKLSIEPQPQDADALVREVVDAFAEAAAHKKVHLWSEIAEDTPLVFCDGDRITEVLSNLVGNALKFTPDGGSIVVSVHRSHESDQEVYFSVRDTGLGIPSEVVPHLFNRFWQKPEHAARGSGLGLFISKGLVEAHHGRIWVTSRPGEGSQFHFVLPAVDYRSP
jgi:signal transduction histidine kinase